MLEYSFKGLETEYELWNYKNHLTLISQFALLSAASTLSHYHIEQNYDSY